MKVEKTPIDLDKRRYLVYDMDAYYELDKVYGSFQGIFDAMADMQEEDILIFLRAGLHEPLDQDITDYYENADIFEKLQIKLNIIQAFTKYMPDPDKETTISAVPSKQEITWDWAFFYFVGNVLFGWSEEVFWSTTPKKFFAIWEKYRRYHGLDKEQPASQPDAQSQAFVDNYL